MFLPRHFLLLAVLLLGGLTTAWADVYKYYDENGNLVLSDSPPKNKADRLEKLEDKPIMTIPALKSRPGAVSGDEPVKARQTTYTIVIQSPADQSTIQRNSGEDIAVAYSVDPALVAGDHVEVTLDGNRVDNASIAADNLERGEHMITVKVFNVANKMVASASSSFYIQQHSALGPTAPKPSPPPKSK